MIEKVLACRVNEIIINWNNFAFFVGMEGLDTNALDIVASLIYPLGTKTPGNPLQLRVKSRRGRRLALERD